MSRGLSAGRAIGAVAGLLALAAAAAIEVDTRSYEGRTQAAIDEFRAAVALEPDVAHGKELFGGCAECHQEGGSGSARGVGRRRR